MQRDIVRRARRSSEAKERSAPPDDGRDRLPCRHVRSGGLLRRQAELLKWLLAQCLGNKAKTDAAEKIEAALTDEALVLLSTRLSTPLQFQTYLTRAFEEGYKVGQKPVTVEVIESILARDIDDLERVSPATATTLRCSARSSTPNRARYAPSSVVSSRQAALRSYSTRCSPSASPCDAAVVRQREQSRTSR